MIKMVSICIPSLNRSVYLLKTLKSIYEQESHNLCFEVCISNNASTDDYSIIEEYVEKIKESHGNVIYISHEKQIPIDEHHHYVTNMARGDYIYFLGDDDCFYPDAFNKISKLLEENDLDLAIFNGAKIDENNKFIGRVLSLPDKKYEDLESAFLDLKDKSPFGAILVKKEYLSNNYFKLLYGTSHAYCCFWLNMMNHKEWFFTIIIPDFRCVQLRRLKKNYSRVDVFYHEIAFYIETFYANVNSDKAKEIIRIFREEHNKKIYSIPFMAYMLYHGTKLSQLKNSSPGKPFFFFKKLISRILAINPIYDFAHSFYFKIIKK
ncbi:glycosyl transferase family protein [Yersinia pseudotuberculosis]|nr:glycosyltransferase family 2 protein [Yersinia pseudotuberculosis]AJJ57564.1 glycosyl transferase 2 family protein [Yersinia pseudotuberculosis YPIII]CFU85071.1 glycosyl transferase family protein [Yersinia pseudotuberculosis]CNB20307.1 glycosyl transferase family protein [Yersinia pseudotuberculosis]CNB24468.1 glycosyl transferase family protein [Yersinia pseudotuberculosis]CNF53156.1 glycosyl transferase family protein [Yersinia pseudotuberculosis]